MPRSWFRNQANMRYDPAVSILCEEFGPLGDLVWRRLLELHCEDDDGIRIRRQDLRTALHLPPVDNVRNGAGGWDIDLDAWLVRAAQLGLIKVKQPRTSDAKRNNTLQIAARRWQAYNPRYASRDAVTERKRRSRAKSVTVTNDESHCDVTVTSQSPRRDVLDVAVQDEQDVAVARARDPEPRLSAIEEPTPNGRGMPESVRRQVDELKRRRALSIAEGAL